MTRRSGQRTIRGVHSGGDRTLDQLRRAASWPLHPFLAALYPVVLVWAVNQNQLVPIGDVLPPLGVAVAGAAVLLGIGRLVFGDLPRAALAATALIVLFFTYGYMWAWVSETLPQVFPKQRWLVATWLVLGLAALTAVRLWGHRSSSLSAMLNGVGVFLLTLNLVSIGAYNLAIRADRVVAGQPSATGQLGDGATPDIYWLIMDRYPSADVLGEFYGFDNSPFLDALRAHGFYVADDATANYLKTAQSLVATRDMEYLDIDELRAEAGTEDDWGPLYRRLGGPFAVQRLLAERGYLFAYIGGYWGPTHASSVADLSLRYERTSSEFQNVLVDTTALRTLAGLWDEELDWRYEHWQINRYQFGRLNGLVDLGGPKFVHVHFTVPHPPYVFLADGSFQPLEDERARPYEENFVGQVEYVNSQLLAFVERLMALPADERPIIILQADEGPRPPRYRADEFAFQWLSATDEELRRKFGILNAMYLPGVDPEEAGLYPSISSVNTFRAIFGAYFGLDLPLLPDRQFVFTNQRHIYDVVEVTDRLRAARSEAADRGG